MPAPGVDAMICRCAVHMRTCALDPSLGKQASNPRQCPRNTRSVLGRACACACVRVRMEERGAHQPHDEADECDQAVQYLGIPARVSDNMW